MRPSAKVATYYLVGALLLVAPAAILNQPTCLACQSGVIVRAGVKPDLEPYLAWMVTIYEAMSALWGYALQMPQLLGLQVIGAFLILKGTRLLLLTSNSRLAKRLLSRTR
jgi:hypothetical protein